jgi:hypothetical protein
LEDLVIEFITEMVWKSEELYNIVLISLQNL